MMSAEDRGFLARWIAANGGAEAVGLGTTFLMGGVAANFFDSRPGIGGVLTAAALAIALGMVLEGVVVGAAQGLVLERRRPEIRLGRWVVATTVGAGLAWTIGTVPSTVMALTTTGPAGAPPERRYPSSSCSPVDWVW